MSIYRHPVLQVNATTIDGVTPLFNACSTGSVACTEVLLEHGAKPQAELCQPSPIHEASSKGMCTELCLLGVVVLYEICNSCYISLNLRFKGEQQFQSLHLKIRSNIISFKININFAIHSKCASVKIERCLCPHQSVFNTSQCAVRVGFTLLIFINS